MIESQFRESRDQAIDLISRVTESWSIGIPPSDTITTHRIISDASKIAQANGELRSLLTSELVEQIDLAVLQFPVKRRIPLGHPTAHHWAIVATEFWLGDLGHYFSAVRPNAFSNKPCDLNNSFVDGMPWDLLWEIIGNESEHAHEVFLAGIADRSRRARKRARIPANVVAMIRSEAAAAMTYSGLEMHPSTSNEKRISLAIERTITETEIRQSLKQANAANSTSTVSRITADSSFPQPFPDIRPKTWRFRDVDEWFKKRKHISLTHPSDFLLK